MPGRYIAGIDIGGTKTAVVIGDMAGITEPLIPPKIIAKKVISTEQDTDPLLFINKIIDITSSLLKTENIFTYNLSSVGISCGGPLDSKAGVVIAPPNLPAWRNVPITRIIENRLEVKAFLQNDANAGALAEWRYGAGRECNNLIFLTFGTGMGAGLILDGKLYSGTNDLAGEVGHIRISEDGPEAYGKKGSFEAFCSGTGIARIARQKVTEMLSKGIKVDFCRTVDDAKKITAKDVCQAARSGDKTAIEILKTSGTYLGKGLSVLIDILNPEKIIIGGVFTRCREFILPHAEIVIEKEALVNAKEVCSIVPSSLGEEIGDYAALSVALLGELDT